MSMTPARVLALTLTFSSVASLDASNWPQWRGPEGRGVSEETAVPLEWAADKNVVWKTPLPAMATRSPSSGATTSS